MFFHAGLAVFAVTHSYHLMDLDVVKISSYSIVNHFVDQCYRLTNAMCDDDRISGFYNFCCFIHRSKFRSVSFFPAHFKYPP